MTHPRGRAGLAERLASITAEGAGGDPAPGNIEESGLDARTHARVSAAAHAVHAALGRATPGLPDGAAGQVAP